MPAIPPTNAVPPLRTLRRVTVVMHSSLGMSELMPFGQSYAGLESLSAYRASVVQHMRTRQRAQDVGSMIILLVFHSQRRGGEFGRKTGRILCRAAARLHRFQS